MTATHWSPPDIWGDILSAAWRPDSGEPVAIHIRPELHARLVPHRPPAALPVPKDSLERLAHVPVVVDDTIPDFPGFEVHRVSGGRATHRQPPGHRQAHERAGRSG